MIYEMVDLLQFTFIAGLGFGTGLFVITESLDCLLRRFRGG